MTPTAELLLGDLVRENEDYRADIESLREVLSVALERLTSLTCRCQQQTDQIRRLMGLHDDELRAMTE